MEPDRLVFLSYSRRDALLAHRVRDDLRAAGLSVWTDEAYTPGMPQWETAVLKALNRAQAVVLLLSPEAKLSGWVQRELKYAAQFGVPVLPILAEGTLASAAPAALDTAPVSDIRERENYAPEMGKLLSALNQFRAQPDTGGAQAQGRLPAADHPLSRLNPRDYARLLYWTLLAPQQLVAYKLSAYDVSIRGVGSWLVNTLCWIPLLIAASAHALHTLPGSSGGSPILIPLVIGGWFVTGWLGEGRDDASAQILIIVSGVIAGGVSLLLLHNVLLAVAFTAVVGVVSGIALGVTETIAFEAMHGVALGLAGGSLLGVLFPLTAREIGAISEFEGGIGYMFGLILRTGALAIFVGASLAFSFSEKVSAIMDENLALRRATPASRSVFAALFIAYAALIWLYLLGGWRVLLPNG